MRAHRRPPRRPRVPPLARLSAVAALGVSLLVWDRARVEAALGAQRDAIARDQQVIDRLQLLTSEQAAQIMRIEKFERASCLLYEPVTRRELPAGAPPNEVEIVERAREAVELFGCTGPGGG